MHEIYVAKDVLEVGLRSIKALALADGNFDDRERGLMRAAARAFTPPDQLPPDPDDLTPIAPEEAAAAITDPVARTRLIQSLIIAALIDGEVSAPELDMVRAFAAAMAVEEPRLKQLKQLVKEQHLMLMVDLNRKSAMVEVAARYAYREQGLKGVWKAMAPFMSPRLAHDEALGYRYRRLGLLGEHTFGRQYWIHIRERGFSFPGEPGGFSEAFIKHDCCHVLGSYDTDPIGECEVIAFIAGFMQSDPFWYVFMIAVHMHLGVETFYKNPKGHLDFDPVRVLHALQRGRQVNTNLYEPGFDWAPLFPMDIDEVRARYNIQPADLNAG